MFEIGVMGIAARAPAIATAAAMAAEADGAHAIWYPERLRAVPDAATWQEQGGPLALVTPDPTDLADPVLAAATAAIATRRATVGVLGLDLPTTDADRVARTVATLAAIAPARIAVAFAAGADVPDRAARAGAVLERLARRDLPVELALEGDDAESARLADALGATWIAAGPVAVDDFAARAAALPAGRAGIALPVVAHEDETVTTKALESPLLAGLAAQLGPAAAHVPVGTPEAVVEQIGTYVAAGARRVVVDNLVALGAPYELEGGQRATRAIVRTARLAFREAGS
jgi:alkanesulfonate monooxygenase SsuD/methylene tetrahydromethanopterin reductase-like flavin-dependent oxidoreductase (luciferase family)